MYFKKLKKIEYVQILVIAYYYVLSDCACLCAEHQILNVSSFKFSQETVNNQTVLTQSNTLKKEINSYEKTINKWFDFGSEAMQLWQTEATEYKMLLCRRNGSPRLDNGGTHQVVY